METSLKTRVIIILIAVILTIGLIGVIIYSQEHSKLFPVTTTTTLVSSEIPNPSLTYNECLGYLNDFQEVTNFQNATVKVSPPQIFCEIKDGRTTLIPLDEVQNNLQAGKTLITIVNASKIFNQEYFTSLKNANLPSLSKGIRVCFSYEPISLTNLFLFPASFQIVNNGENKISACSDFEKIQDLKNLGTIGTLPLNSHGQQQYFTISAGSLTNPTILTPVYTSTLTIK